MAETNEPLDLKSLTTLLQDAKAGDAMAEQRALQEVFGRLRSMAAYYLSGERKNHTLQPTALVNEVYLRMFDSDKAAVDWQNRDQFFVLAGRAMRQILVDYARTKKAEKRGSGEMHLAIEDLKGAEPSQTSSIETILAVDAALVELAKKNSRMATIVEQKFFGQLSYEQIAQGLGMTASQVRQEWNFAKGWLADYLRPRM